MSAEVLIDRAAFSDDPAALEALQTAIDAGGTVVVTGVFSLAEGQSLVVGQQDQDVTITAGHGAAFLVGGTNTIRQIRPVQMTLVDLNITASRASYVHVQATSGTSIRGCSLTGLLLEGNVASGIRVMNLVGAGPAALLIVDNAIDAGNTTWVHFTALNNGILINNVTIDLDATIMRNRIQAAQTAGIFVNQSEGSYTIQKNHIIVAGDESKDESKGPLLWAVGVWGRGVNAGAPRSFIVADNDIEATQSAFAIGYGDFRKDGGSPTTIEVHHNRVVMAQGVFSTFLLHGNVDGSEWKHNTVTGTTHNVFAIVDDKWDPAKGNLFDQNDLDVELADVEPHPFLGEIPKKHLYFSVGANNNVAKGFAALEWEDDGQSNIIR